MVVCLVKKFRSRQSTRHTFQASGCSETKKAYVFTSLPLNFWKGSGFEENDRLCIDDYEEGPMH